MADDSDITRLQQAVDDLQKLTKFHATVISDNYKEFMSLDRTVSGLAKSAGGDPALAKEVEALKARVKELEAKLAKMGKR